VTKSLSRLTPTAVATYLVRAGWTRMGEGNTGTVWAGPLDGGIRHLFQPEDHTRPDYALRVAEMIAALAVAEDRSESAILTDLCVVNHGVASRVEAEAGTAARRTDWMEPEYGLRRADLALVLDLAACRVERHAFVLELERLDWPLDEAAELADLVCECELVAAESMPATVKTKERADGLG
jgi:hypothetical protein